MAKFEPAVEKLLKVEGGFARYDSTAGAVNHGITQRFLQSVGLPCSVGYVRGLTAKAAAEIYHKYFWATLRLGELDSQKLAETVLLAAVNIGSSRAVRMLQKVLRDMGAQIRVDGVLGPKTLRAANSMPPENLIYRFKAQLAGFYRRLARRYPTRYGQYLDGWLGRLEV